jgi:hypothetical protein
MEQLILHLVGDFVLQSDWMARNKVKRLWPALVHVTVYSVPFLLIGSVTAVSVIFVTHLIIDRYRLARYVVWLKNWFGPGQYPWHECSITGFHNSTPEWLAVWLMIVVDATLHLICNYCALRWL